MNFVTPVHESNDCHTPAGSPAGGQFCSSLEDEHGNYLKYGDAVDPGANWKRFDALSDDAQVALYHATSRANAEGILKHGYTAARGYTDSSPDHVYLGGRGQGAGTYIGQQGRGDPVLVVFTMRKGDIEPDAGSDWKSHARLYKQDVIRFHGRDVLKHPTATATFATINQVRVRKELATPIGYVDLKTGKFVRKR